MAHLLLNKTFKKHYMNSKTTDLLRRVLRTVICIIVISTLSSIADAQLGSGCAQYSRSKKIHLDNEDGLQIYNWTSYKSVCSPVCADYSYASSTETETFRLL